MSLTVFPAPSAAPTPLAVCASASDSPTQPNFCSGRPSTAELVGFVAYTDSFQNTLAGKSKNRRFYFLEKQGTSEFVRRLGTLSKSLAIFLVCRDKFERFLSFSEIETPVFRFCSPVVCFETNLYMPRISTQTGFADGRSKNLRCGRIWKLHQETARGVGAADGTGNTVSENWEREKRLFILQPLFFLIWQTIRFHFW